MHSITTSLLTLILAFALLPASQTRQKAPPPQEKAECGTVLTPEQVKAELARANSAPLAAVTPPLNAPYYLPLTIHIVHYNDGSGGFTPVELDIAMRDLNRLWQPAGIQFFIYGEIDHINDDNFFHLPNEQAARDALRQVNTVPQTINVYYTNLKICGQSSFTSSEVQGVLLDNNCGRAGVAFAHELGHYFDLYHTHETGFGVECPSGSNSDSAGDRLRDTPADPGLFSGVDDNCVYDNSAALPADCDGTPYAPPTRNLMSYSRRFCMAEFTPDQISKMLGVLRDKVNRKDLINSGTRYVDPVASNSNNRCTYTEPCRTVAKAVAAATSGDFIFLRARSYQTPSLSGKHVTLSRWGTEGVVTLKP